MSPLFYQIVHVTCAFLLVGFTFQAFAAPSPEKRSACMIKTGVMSVFVLVAGFGLSAKMGYGFPIWMMIKLVCLLGISAVSGMAFRKPEKAGGLALLAIVFILGAVLSVYTKPFGQSGSSSEGASEVLPEDAPATELPG